MPPFAVAGATVRVEFSLPGSNGCYRQSPARTAIAGQEITHSYRTWTEGGMCTMALVPGGFAAELRPRDTGVLRGTVRVDEQVRASYRLRVAASERERDAQLLAAMPTLTAEEKRWVALHFAEEPNRVLELAFLERVRLDLRQPDAALFTSLLDWLERTTTTSVVERAAPDLDRALDGLGHPDHARRIDALLRRVGRDSGLIGPGGAMRLRGPRDERPGNNPYQ